jgi:WD40 repeat protein
MSNGEIQESMNMVDGKEDPSSIGDRVINDYISYRLGEIIKRTGTSNVEEMYKGIETGDISNEETIKIEKEIEGLFEYKENASLLLPYYYPKGVPAYSLENVEGREIKEIRGIENVASFQVLSSDNLITGHTSGEIRLWLGRSGSYNIYHPILIGDTPSSYVHTLQVFQNREVVSGNASGRIQRWSIKEDGNYDQIKSTLVGKCDTWVGSIHVLPCGDVVSGGYSEEIYRWPALEDDNDELLKPITVGNIKQLGPEGLVRDLQVFPNGDVVSGDYYGNIYRWSIKEDGEYEKANPVEVGKHTRAVFTLQILPNGDVVSGGEDGYIHLWPRNEDGNYDKGLVVGKHSGSVDTLQVLPGGDVVSGGTDRILYYWQSQPDGSYTKREVCKHRSTIRDIQVLPNGDIVFSDSDGKLLISKQNK